MVWQRAAMRQGTHKEKGRHEVSGGGRKPWAQKKTGRARAGSIRAPQFRGGGVVHPITPKDYSYPLPKKVRMLALKVALSSKVSSKQLIIFDNINLATHKTKESEKILKDYNLSSALICAGESVPQNLELSTLNHPSIDSLSTSQLSVLQLLRRKHLLLSREAVLHLHRTLLDLTYQEKIYPLDQLDNSTFEDSSTTSTTSQPSLN